MHGNKFLLCRDFVFGTRHELAGVLQSSAQAKLLSSSRSPSPQLSGRGSVSSRLVVFLIMWRPLLFYMEKTILNRTKGVNVKRQCIDLSHYLS